MDKSKGDGEWRESGGGRRIDRRNAYLFTALLMKSPFGQERSRFPITP